MESPSLANPHARAVGKAVILLDCSNAANRVACVLSCLAAGPIFFWNRRLDMPFGGNDWLALTQEDTLEPGLPICDPHHHFWDLRPQRLPYQRYLLHELLDDIGSGHNVTSTVFVEARSMYRAEGPEEMQPVGEVEFVQGLAAAGASGVYGSAPARRIHCRPRQSEPRVRCPARAGGPAVGQSQPIPGNPSLGDLGPPPRSRKHGGPQHARATRFGQLHGRGPRPV